MSSTSTRTRASQLTEDEIRELVLRLQEMLPQRNTTEASTSTILEETCSYIRRLHKELGDLSQRLSQLLHHSAADVSELDEELITRLLSNIH